MQSARGPAPAEGRPAGMLRQGEGIPVLNFSEQPHVP